MQIKNKYYKCTQYTCIVDTHRIYIIIYRNTRLKYLLLVFQSISADLLNEIKAFGDIASQQRARLEVSKTLLSESNRSLKVTFYLLFLLIFTTFRKSRKRWEASRRHENKWFKKGRTFPLKQLNWKELSKKRKLFYSERFHWFLNLNCVHLKSKRCVYIYLQICILMAVWVKLNKEPFPHVPHSFLCQCTKFNVTQFVFLFFCFLRGTGTCIEAFFHFWLYKVPHSVSYSPVHTSGAAAQGTHLLPSATWGTSFARRYGQLVVMAIIVFSTWLEL